MTELRIIGLLITDRIKELSTNSKFREHCRIIVLQTIRSRETEKLGKKLFAGSSIENPIDFLATGTAEQLGDIIDACENDFENIDAIAVIFGSPGLFGVSDVYDILDKKMKSCRKLLASTMPSMEKVNRLRQAKMRE